MATMHMNRMDREDHLHTAFQYFDKDGSGCITQEDAELAVKKSWNLAEYQRGNSISKDTLPNTEAVLNPYT